MFGFHMINPLDNNGIFGAPANVLREAILRTHKDWFDHAMDVNQAMHSLLYLMRPHQLVAQEMLVAVLFVRAMTQYQSALLLAMNGLPFECRIILRSLIELIIYLRASHLNIRFAKAYTLKHDRERRKLFKLVKRSPSLKHYADEMDIDDEISKINDSLKGDKEDIQLEEFAKEAQMLPIYHTAYKVFNDTVHSGIGDLQIHLNGTTPDTVTEIRYGMSGDEINHILLVATELMLLCVEPISQRFSLPDIPEIQLLIAQHESISKK